MGKPCMIVTVFQITIFNLQFCVILDKTVNRIALSNLKLYLEYTHVDPTVHFASAMGKTSLML